MAATRKLFRFGTEQKRAAVSGGSSE